MTPDKVQAFVAVGSNIDPEANIPAALSLLCHRTETLDSSTFYRTRPVGTSAQPPFVNGVWAVAATVPAQALKFDILRPIERELGRVRTEDKYAPRPIDLDLVLFGDSVLAEPDLTIPDPDIRTRPFLAAPLLELAPALRLPDDGIALADLPVSTPSSDMVPVPELTQSLRSLIRKEN